MKPISYVIITLALLLSFGNPLPAQAMPTASVIPTFSIVSVVVDTSVTIRTYNFPAHDTFKVLMGKMGTRGVGGIPVATISSGTGGSFTATFNIPSGVQGLYKIAIRLESTSGSGYYAYNWFYNNTAGGSSSGGYSGIPTFSISGVVKDTSVSILTHNFPKNDSFKVLMGNIGTKGIGGIKVTTVNSDGGGSLSFTFNIPDALKGKQKIAIRLQSNTGSGYYAYNWFWNNTTGSSGGGGSSSYSGFPTFSIVSVVRNTSVTIKTHNLPPHDKFKVLMGLMGTRGINGYKVEVLDSGSGGAQTLTFNIPPELAGKNRISIRLQSVTGSGYYAYNWFFNTTTP
jgi:hypothetical protein